MALVACRECQKEISSEAIACPHCGLSPARAKPSGGFLKSLWRLIGVLAGLFVLVFGIFFVKALVSPGDPKTDPYSAIRTGKESLEANLKDPDSVQYGDVWAGRMNAGSSTDGPLVACGYYNAKNSFGGMGGQKRFIGGAGGMVLTDEMPDSDVMSIAWQEACVAGRVR
jgi:hypothetical protein